MSEEVYSQAGFSPDVLPRREVAARGRLGVLQARPVARAADLADLLGESVVSAPAS
jgi:hypothetical protein